MKSALLLIFTCIVSIVVGQESGVLKFDKTEIDYGVINKGEDGVRVFMATNVGKYPVQINSCSATCGCTVPTCPQLPILPGKTVPVPVKYNTTRIGKFSKQITVYSNDQENQVIILKILGEVKE